MNYLDTPSGRRIAHHLSPGRGPCIVFLGGFRSDMEGTKAVHLDDWARGQGRAFLRLDYSGHGRSSGRFEDGCIGDWADDATETVARLIDGPVVLVGSSMGGWISMLVARRLGRMAGFVGIAAAPDFTEDGFWSSFDEGQRARLMRDGQIALPSAYGDPTIVTRRLIEDGRRHLVLRDPAPDMGRVRLLQGTDDADVPRDTALRLLDHLRGDVRLTLVKGADHRFSDPRCLSLIEAALRDVLAPDSQGPAPGPS
ncbi:hypothetical protein OCGS_0002 [Oceaniovalibus guishaninsula JLT2003]|uniref:Palmitoyl-protein thioesterase ABHD10, mitochondrial n=1 Tax=Oceaniovalibus guishaninsula JLT2003 TaxID=1231392 RepID=K2GT97_9RHOB|nr:alpha/beta hydrolase [Oceaniovalibus guishaninsula]EKE45776.1 hypothetical protein OCGS_0002 [Oceaniovalibus guishaninsula JLT2003]